MKKKTRQNKSVGLSKGLPDLPRWLLLLSRETLTPCQREILASLDLTDLELQELSRHCRERLVAPIAYRHLREIWGDQNKFLNEDWLNKAQKSVMVSMKFASEMIEFHRACVEHVSSKHLYFKGPTLAYSFYEEPHLRPCRDIDVLIPKGEVRHVVNAALEQGYKIHDAEFEKVKHRGSEAISAYVQMRDVAVLLSPKGICFEIHSSLDRRSRLFEPSLLFGNSVVTVISGQPFHVIDKELLFCYVVYHSTSHAWSRLNWITDSSAILCSEGFDRDVCRRWARKIGILDLVEAAFEFVDWCEDGAVTPFPESLGARELYDLFDQNIRGGLDFEIQLKKQHNGLGLPRRYQATLRARIRALFHFFRLVLSAPNFALYCRYPLPSRFWWLYVIIRPPVMAVDRLSSLAGRGR